MAGKTRRRRRNHRRRGISDILDTSNGSTEGYMIPASGENLQWLPRPQEIYRWAYETGAPFTSGDELYHCGSNHPGFLPQNEWRSHSFADINGQTYTCSVMHTCPSPCVYYPSNYGYGQPYPRYSSSYMTNGFASSAPVPLYSGFPLYHQQSFGLLMSHEASVATAVMSYDASRQMQETAVAFPTTLVEAPVFGADIDIANRGGAGQT